MKKDISIITPLYNGEKYIAHCIDSVLAQNTKTLNYEIIIINDGSIDNSAVIINEYASKHPQTIKAIHQDNKGASEARRVALKHASGDYVVFLDADDWLEPNALQSMYDRCKEHSLDFLECTFIKYKTPTSKYFTRHKYTGFFNKADFYNILFDVNEEIAITCAMSRRELWTDDMFLPEGVRLPNEDLFPLYSLANKISRIEITNELPIYHYRYNPNSATHTNVLIKQQYLWEQYFGLLRNKLIELGILNNYETQVRIMEVNRLAFNVVKHDTKNNWYKSVINYDTSAFDTKHKILAFLLKYPTICRFLINTNRRLKSFVTF